MLCSPINVAPWSGQEGLSLDSMLTTHGFQANASVDPSEQMTWLVSTPQQVNGETFFIRYLHQQVS